MSANFYQHHLFFCTNQREDGADCCASYDAQGMRDYAKARCKELGIHGPGQTRVNSAGCLDRCDHGPVCVVYPEGVWYTWVDRSDIDEIIDKHLKNNEIVKRLQI